jgi:hypothetical protein
VNINYGGKMNKKNVVNVIIYVCTAVSTAVGVILQSGLIEMMGAKTGGIIATIFGIVGLVANVVYDIITKIQAPTLPDKA